MTVEASVEASAGLFGAVDAARAAVRTVDLLRALRAWVATAGPGFAEAMEIDEVSAMVLVAAAPASTTDELLVPAIMAVWMQVADDRVDRVTHRAGEFEELVRRWRELARGARPESDDPLDLVLAALVRRLHDAPRHHDLLPVWLRRFDLMMDAWTFEHTTVVQLARGEPPPAVTTYLDHHHSFGLGPIVLAWWVTADDDLSEALDVLLTALDALELAVRLANDLLNVHRQRTALGSVDILQLGADVDWVDKAVDRHLRRSHDLLQPLIERGSPTARALGRVGEWLVTFYLQTDARLAG